MNCSPSRNIIVSLICAAGLASSLRAQDEIGGVAYEKARDRQTTESRMIEKLLDRPGVSFGAWYLLTPFPGSEQGMLAIAHEPERELTRMSANGPGPDLQASYRGRGGAEVSWRPLGSIDNRPISLRVFETEEENSNGTAYLYRTITAEGNAEIPVTMGSDDGLRVWINGKLIIDADVPRGLNPDDHKVTIKLAEGVNHMLCKVTQGRVGWDYQMNTSAPLDPTVDARLQARLDADFPSREDEFYPKVTIPVPDDVVLEVGGLGVMPDGRAAVCTRRGDVYIVSWTVDDAPFDAEYHLFASGLHEPLGLAARAEDGGAAIYCTQRAELTRMVDLDGDDAADLYQSFCDQWGVSGNYHEFAFGPKFDDEGYAWVTLNVGFCGSLGKSVAPWRGWAVRISPDGSMEPICDGLRSPNGIGFLPDGTPFYVDNQGDFVGTCRMTPLLRGSWAGHPAGLHWREQLEGFAAEPPRLKASVWFPYKKMGQSTADIALCKAEHGFGPFAGQLFCGDQTMATVMRVDLEKIGDVYQGACFPFREGLDCGVNRLAFDGRGGLLVGQTDRGWGSAGRKRYGLQRIAFSGATPFEILNMRAAPDGFVLRFTEELDRAAATNPASYAMKSYTYEYHRAYGSDEMEMADCPVVRATLLDPRTVHLVVDNVRTGGESFVHELTALGVMNARGEPLLHTDAYYTLQVLPGVMPAMP